jgi:hypothetical protein
MTEIASRLEALRHSCGNLYTHFRDHRLGATRTGVFEVPCDSYAAVQPSVPVTFRSGCRSDLEAFSREEHEYGDAERQFGRERLEKGDSLIVGESDGAVVFYAWQMYRQVDVDQGICIPMPPDVAYSYKVFTVSRARGLSICSAYYNYVKAYLLAQGYRRLVCRVDPTNAPSLRAHLRAGFCKRGLLWKVVMPTRAIYYADRPLRAWFKDVGTGDLFSRRGILHGSYS